MGMFENHNPELQERSKGLRLVAEILKRFVLAGTILVGSEAGIVQQTEFKDYSLAEVMELVDDQEREFLLKMAQEKVSKPVSIESNIPTQGEDVKISEIRNYLATLPKKWTKGEITRIKTTTKKEDLNTSRSGALATYNNESKRILFDYNVANTQERRYNIHALSHEVAHGNDFLTDVDLSWNERYSLYKKVKDRLKSEDRFKTHYLVDLEQEFSDGEIHWILFAREYWAEICAQYMSDPTQLHIDDFKLVHEFVIKNEPDYKWRERLGERAKIQGEFSNPHIPKLEK